MMCFKSIKIKIKKHHTVGRVKKFKLRSKIDTINTQIHDCYGAKVPGAYLRKIAPMASTKIALYIYYLLIISPGIHVYCVLHSFCKITSRKLYKTSFLGRSHMGTLGTKTSQWHPLQVAPRACGLVAIP
jgi:hypothetical protein